MVHIEFTPDIFQQGGPTEGMATVIFDGFNRVKKTSFNRVAYFRSIKETDIDAEVKKLIQINACKLTTDLLNAYLNHEDFFMTIDGMVIKENLMDNLEAISHSDNYQSFVRIFNFNIIPILERMSIIFSPETDFFKNIDGVTRLMLFAQKTADFYPRKTVFCQ